MKIKHTISAGLLFLATLSFTTAAAQRGPFPTLEGETLEGQKLSIPGDTRGKFTLLGLAYSKKSEKDLETWFEPVYRTFLQDAENAGMFAAFAYDVNVYFVPMFTGVKSIAAGKARKKAVKDIDERLHPNILFYVGKLDEYKQQLEMDKKDVPYFFVLDKEGNIIYATTGSFSDKKMNEIEDLVSE